MPTRQHGGKVEPWCHMSSALGEGVKMATKTTSAGLWMPLIKCLSMVALLKETPSWRWVVSPTSISLKGGVGETYHFSVGESQTCL